MKKIIITSLFLFTTTSHSSDYVVYINDNYIVGGYTDNITYTDWISTNETECIFDKIESDVYYGKTFNQKEICTNKEERTFNIIRVYDNGNTEIISSEKEYKYVQLDEKITLKTGTHLESSCNDIITNGYANNDGIYAIGTNESNLNVYCDMTTNGGGWTMVLAQFEADPVTFWNEGIQTDYDPSLVSSKSFTLETSEIPEHNEISIGYTDITGLHPSQIYFSYKYTTGNIEKTLVTSNYNENYYIHRNSGLYFNYHDPDTNEYYSTNDYWFNTLTIEKIDTSKHSLSWAFSPKHTTQNFRGYAYNGVWYQNVDVLGAWTLWVR